MKMDLMMINKTLTVGVIQTSLDASAAWQSIKDVGGDWKKCVQMSSLEERRAKKEIRHFLSSLKGMEQLPDIVVLPELSVPIGFKNHLRSIAEKMETIIIAGLDYQIISKEPEPKVSNEAVIVVPRKLKCKQIARQTELRLIGKTYASSAEKRKFDEINVMFQPRPTVWLFESKTLGNFAVAICYDFLDLDRIVLYRNKIQTLFILSHNKDTNSFDHVAEAITRMVFCNVVVCNCGHFGGSLAISPFREPYTRTIYRHSGQKLPNAQLIELPLRSLVQHQQSGTDINTYKSLPPGFNKKPPLNINTEKL